MNKFAKVIDQVLASEQDKIEDVEASTVDEFKKLNEQCDAVIVKIKTRKNKVKNTKSGE